MSINLVTEQDGDLPPSQLLARRVREVMAGRQITGSRVAEGIGLDQRAFSRRYRGVTPWTVDELYALAAALGMDVSSLLPRLDSNQQPFDYRTNPEAVVVDLDQRRRARSM